MLRAAVLAACTLGPVWALASEVRFVDRAPELGLSHQYLGGWEHFVGGGVAAMDCNADGLPEIFLAGGSAPSQLLRNETPQAGAPLRFAPAVQQPPAGTGVIGAYPLDIDSDGLTDLAVLRVGENRLLRGLGDCVFEDMGAAWGFDGSDRWTTAFSATWQAGAVFPTLAFGNYVDRDDPEGPFFACDDNHLYRPEGPGYGAITALTPGYCALSMLFSDWGRQGVQDLRVSNDRHYFVRGGQEQLWQLTPEPRAYTEADGWMPLSIWGMGIASRDLTGDGLPEVFLTSIGDQKLQRLSEAAPGPTYSSARYESGTTAHVPYIGNEGRPSTGWHAAFGDVDNDGREDLFIAKGNVDQMPDAAMRDPNNLLLQTASGSFAEHGDSAGLATTARSRGAAVIDLNADGLLDIVVNNRRAAVEVHENRTQGAGGWLAVKLSQPAPNTDAVGAWIEVSDGRRTWHREVTIGGGHGGGQLGVHHFGIDDARALTLRVIWPDGVASPAHSVVPGQHLWVTRGAAPVALSPPRN